MCTLYSSGEWVFKAQISVYQCRRGVGLSFDDDLASADLLVVGAGFFGATVAERAANILNKKVVVIDRRDHIAGNAYSYIDSITGIEVHKYGSHIFHTDNEIVWNYITGFSSFNDYEHRVFSVANSEVYQLPFNLLTLSQVLKRSVVPSEAKEFLLNRTTNKKYANLEEKAIELVGEQIYEKLIKGYTSKQWQADPKELPSEIITRLPVRVNFDSRYFDDKYQGLPLCGYTELIRRMLDNERITVHLGIDYFKIKDKVEIPVVYSGPIDEFFEFSRGRLGWRTIDLEFEIHETDNFQGTAVMNYADLEIPYTRVHEFRFLHPERIYSSSTIIAKEYSRSSDIGDEPYYPINSDIDRKMLNEYRELCSKERKVIFGGRLGSYKYLDMHMAIASALQVSNTALREMLES